MMKRMLCIWLPDWPPSEMDLFEASAALEVLAGQCERFSPVVGIEPAAVPDSLMLDVTGLTHLFGGEVALMEKIVGHFQRRELAVRVSIADTLGAAWAIAHFYRPSSCHLIPPGQTVDALQPLPIRALRLPEETVDRLRQLGIGRIGQLEALPRREITSRLGPELIRRWDQAIGHLAEPVRAHRPPPEFQADWSPEHPTTRRETIEAAIEQLVARIARQLLARGQGVLRMTCRLEWERGTEALREAASGDLHSTLTVGLFEPTASAGHLVALLQMQWDRLRLPGPISSLSIAAASTAPLILRQREMFACRGDAARRPSRHIAGLIDRLSSRLGRRSVLHAKLLSDAQPERAYRYEPLVGGPRRRRVRRPELPPRPLRLLPRPLALTATSTTSAGPPLEFRAYGEEHCLAESWGPERIETGWWRGRTIGRDYYQIATTTGRRFWLFCSLRDGRWFLHGVF